MKKLTSIMKITNWVLTAISVLLVASLFSENISFEMGMHVALFFLSALLVTFFSLSLKGERWASIFSMGLVLVLTVTAAVCLMMKTSIFLPELTGRLRFAAGFIMWPALYGLLVAVIEPDKIKMPKSKTLIRTF